MHNPNHMDFYGLGIAPGILEILEQMKITIPTSIQYKAIPPALAGEDIIGIAQTGTGKTLAFGIPMLQALAHTKGQGLVLAPTRELAQQVDETLKKIGKPFQLKTALLIGGASFNNQEHALKNHPRVIIATPGRLIDHLKQRTLTLSDVRVLVLDEADRMLDMGFAPQIERILHNVPKKRQTLIFSASIPRSILDIATRYMKLPIHIEISPSGTAAERVTQELFIVKKEVKDQLLQKLLETFRGSVLLFARTRFGAAKITKRLQQYGYNAAEIHSNLTLSQRRKALEGFKSGQYRILVATDIAARGIDVHGIELVINYDLPDDVENYIHRIGRTGRAGHEGHAISFATPDQRTDVRKIETLMKAAIPISEHPNIPLAQFAKPQVLFSSHRMRRRR